MTSSDNIVNIVLIGKEGSGKTLFMNNVANDFHLSEFHKENHLFNLRLYLTEDRDRIPIEVRIWDISSKPCFHSALSLPITNADIIFYISRNQFKVSEYIEYKSLIDNFVKKECIIYYLENKFDLSINVLQQVSNFRHTYELDISNKTHCELFINNVILNYLEKRHLEKNNNNYSESIEFSDGDSSHPLLQNRNKHNKKMSFSKILKSIFCCILND